MWQAGCAHGSVEVHRAADLQHHEQPASSSSRGNVNDVERHKVPLIEFPGMVDSEVLLHCYTFPT